jgi:hypothetical protein
MLPVTLHITDYRSFSVNTYYCQQLVSSSRLFALVFIHYTSDPNATYLLSLSPSYNVFQLYSVIIRCFFTKTGCLNTILMHWYISLQQNLMVSHIITTCKHNPRNKNKYLKFLVYAHIIK